MEINKKVMSVNILKMPGKARLQCNKQDLWRSHWKCDDTQSRQPVLMHAFNEFVSVQPFLSRDRQEMLP